MNITDKERIDFLENIIKSGGIMNIDAGYDYGLGVIEEPVVKLFTRDSQWIEADTLREAVDCAINMQKSQES